MAFRIDLNTISSNYDRNNQTPGNFVFKNVNIPKGIENFEFGLESLFIDVNWKQSKTDENAIVYIQVGSSVLYSFPIKSGEGILERPSKWMFLPFNPRMHLDTNDITIRLSRSAEFTTKPLGLYVKQLVLALYFRETK